MDAAFYKPRRQAAEDLGPLFAPVIPEAPPVAVADHQTSRDAADRVVAIAGALRVQILAIIRDAGDHGVTALELEEIPEFRERYSPSTVRKRLSEISKYAPSPIRANGVRRGCTVWIAAQ